MSCECPNQQQMCDPIRGLPFNPPGIPFIDEDLDEDQPQTHAVVVGNDLRSPEAQGLIGIVNPRRVRDSEKRRRPKANDVRINMSERPGAKPSSRPRKASLRRSLRGLADKVRRTSVAETSGGRSSGCCSGKPGCKATAMSTVLSAAYFLLAVIAAVVTYSLVANLVEALRYPVRAVRYKQVAEQEAPVIAILAGDEAELACGHYHQNGFGSKVKLSQLDFVNQSCIFLNLTYKDPTQDGSHHNVLLFRGPTQVQEKEAVFIHLRLNAPTDDFSTIGYFLFPGWDRFNASLEEDRLSEIHRWRRNVSVTSLGAGFRYWIKMTSKETHIVDSKKHTKLQTECTAVKHWDRRPFQERNSTHLFFLFYEWKDDLVEEIYLLYTTTVWHLGACLCAVFLMLHQVCTVLRTSFKKVKRNRRKRKYCSLNSKNSKAEPEEHGCECACVEAADKNQSCDNES